MLPKAGSSRCRPHYGDAYPQRSPRIEGGIVIDLPQTRTCDCPPGKLNCLSAKDWLKSQIGVWQVAYEGRDIRDKDVHPATFPLALARRVITTFTHQGELVVDPFCGSGTSLVAAQDTDRNAIGCDLSARYVKLAQGRLQGRLWASDQVAIHEDARRLPVLLNDGAASLIWTSPPYADMLATPKRNKSRRDRKNYQLGRIEQYSQDAYDLGTLSPDAYRTAMGDVFEGLLPKLRPGGHCVINVNDLWRDGKRITIHVDLIEELRQRGYEFVNTIIWDRRPLVNRTGIFGWPKTYITMTVTFEYILDFIRPT